MKKLILVLKDCKIVRKINVILREKRINIILIFGVLAKFLQKFSVLTSSEFKSFSAINLQQLENLVLYQVSTFYYVLNWSKSLLWWVGGGGGGCWQQL